MAYSHLENLKMIIAEQELKNLTNDENSIAETINIEKVNNAIDYADRLIDTYLRNKYVLPLKFIPPIIEQLSVDIAAYRLYSRRPRKLPEHIVTNYQEAIKILTALQKEQMILDLPHEHTTEDVNPPARMIVTNKTASSRLFGEKTWNQFR